MFQGLIRNKGVVKSSPFRKGSVYRLMIESCIDEELNLGDSVAIDGVCLTLVALENKLLTFEVMDITFNKSIIKFYTQGKEVNVELPIKLNDRIDGHLLQGHVDAVGTVSKIVSKHDNKIITISIPSDIIKFCASSGSIGINGVSLTIQDVKGSAISVGIIPETLKRTNLGKLKIGDKVNIETDMFARYTYNILTKGGMR